MSKLFRRACADPFLARVAGPTALLVLVTIGLLLFSAIFAARRSNDLAFDRQAAVVAQAVALQRDELTSEQATVAAWDDAVLRLARPTANDLQWADDNIGVWLHATYGHDAVYLLDADGQPFYAMTGGGRTRVSRFTPAAAAVQRLRHRLDAQARDSLADLALVDGRPAFVALSRIRPLTSAVAKPSRAPLLVSIVALDGGFLHKLERRNLLDEARVSRTDRHGPGEASQVLSDASGAPLAFIVWRPTAPGGSVLRALLPTTLAAVVVVAGLVAWVLRDLRRATSRLRASEAHAQRLAFHDTLTGLPNRALFQDRLDQAFARARRGEDKVALLYLDLDRFKAVNDRLGHAAGDALIQAFGKRVQAVLRQTDTLARFGGDEFAIIQEGVRGPGDVESLCQRILATVAAPFDLLGAEASVGVSIGVALAPDHAGDRIELARRADIALYRSKGAGRDRASLFTDDMDQSVQFRAQVEADLRQALETGTGLEVCYQPLYTQGGRRLSGCEALVRWRHPVRGAISPALFIPIAEDCGLIGRLGEWVLGEACRLSAARPGLVVSVNVSPLQLGAPGAADRLLSIIARNGAEPRHLEFELTETAFLDELETIGGAIARLRAAGVRIALDDFGTGYSSLTHLKNFAVDKIKIDGSFIQGMDSSDGALAVVAALVRLGQAMNIRVTAEGVETLEQMRALSDMGCAEMQGFLFSAAVPAERLPREPLRPALRVAG